MSDEQLLHVDFGNHTLVVPRHEPGYQQLEMFVYLSDVTPETAATRMVSRRLTADIQVERTYLSQTDYADLYAAEVPASGPAGSILAYRPDVYHRGRAHDGAPDGAVHGARLLQAGRHRLAGLARLAQRRRGHVVVPVRAARHRASAHRPGVPGTGPSLLERADAGRGGRPLPDARPLTLARRRRRRARARRRDAADEPWWKAGVLYQIYPRSFADSNADGVGDIPGIIEHLDHLAWLGVDGIWLSPVTVSPNADWGYDVSDFCAIAPEFGTMEDFDRLVAEAAGRGIRVLMDIVPNHTSEEHPVVRRLAFLAHSGPPGLVRLGRRQGGRGSRPNNWVSSFGGPGWTLDETTGQYYFHNHLQEQPDLNWWNEEVRATFDDIFRFWSDRGVAGFRIDVCNIIIKDAELRDNPPATEDDDFETQMFGQRSVYNANRPEVHEVIRRWRRLADELRGAPAPDRGDAGPGGQAGGVLRRRDRRAGARLQLQLHQRALPGPGDAGHRGGDRGGVAAGGLAGVDGLQPRHVPLPHPLGRGRPGQGPPGAPHAALPARHPGPLPGRRDRHGERRAGPGGPARPPRGALLPVLRGA